MATRRKFLGAGAALLVAGASTTPAMASPDAELIAMAEEFVRLEGEYEVACRAEDLPPDAQGAKEALARMEAISDRQDELYNAMCDVPARTPAGLQAKAGALLAWLPKASDATPYRSEDQLAWSLVRDVLGEA